MTGRYYTGVGSRMTPADVLVLMQRVARHLAELGYILRSGGAAGADRAFEQGCDSAGGEKEIYLPWARFNNSDVPFRPIPPIFFELAADVWPNGAGHFRTLSETDQTFHARNVQQVLGSDMKTPSLFVLCWTPDGATSHDERWYQTGGTGTAISIASRYGIPVFNLKRADHRDRIEVFLERKEEERAHIDSPVGTDAGAGGLRG